MGKSFQELDLSNAYLFAAAMQNEKKKNIAKRVRYYQAEMDMASLKPGEDYTHLKPSYIIFICTFDPFGKGLYRYTFHTCCEETKEQLANETCQIFISTKGTNDNEVSPELVHFLKYIENSTDDVAEQYSDKTVNYLHSRVQGIKRNREMEAGYMYLHELLDDEKAEGRIEGRIAGLAEALGNMLSIQGDLPEDIQSRINNESDTQILNGWIKLAAQVDSIEEFRKQM